MPRALRKVLAIRYDWVSRSAEGAGEGARRGAVASGFRLFRGPLRFASDRHVLDSAGGRE